MQKSRCIQMRIRKTMAWGFLWVASVAVAGAQQINAAGATFPMPISALRTFR